YIILAPMAIACAALPARAGNQMVRMWFHGIISIIMVQFLQLMAVVVTELMLSSSHRTSSMFLILQNADGNTTGVLQQILGIAMMWFVLRIPSLLGTAPMRTMMEAGQAMQQAAVTSIGVSVAEAQMVVQAAGGALQAGVGAGMAG